MRDRVRAVRLQLDRCDCVAVRDSSHWQLVVVLGQRTRLLEVITVLCDALVRAVRMGK